MAKKKNNTEEVAASVDAVTTTAPAEQVINETVVDETVETEIEETAIETETENTPPTVRYSFTKNAPKSIRYNGEVYTQEEVLTNEDLLAELVHGKCIFIKRN